MNDFFDQPLCIGDRVAFVTNKGVLKMAQIVGFKGEEPYRIALLFTDGKRSTEAQCSQVIKEIL